MFAANDRNKRRQQLGM